MPKILTPLTLSLVACLGALYCHAAYALDERWFKVELLVFSHEAPTAHTATAAEQWEPTPELAYPGAARFLVDPKQVQANLKQYPGDSTVDEFGRQLVTIQAETDAPQPNTAARVTAPARPAPLQPVYEVPATAAAPVGSAQTRAATTADTPAAARLTVPTPFTVLPSQQREFRGKAAYMQRRGLYSTLFHQSWLQRVAAQAQSLPIVIDRSGDSGQWPRLQGSVKLYLSRYLHLETNLWLNTHGEYLPGNWQMPAPPLGPPSLVIEDLSTPEPLPGMVAYQDTGAAAPTAQDTVDTASPTASGVEAAPTTEAVQPEDVVEEMVEEGPVYPWRHAVLLQQKRRMRSNEVHYIDHPLLGIVIKITPVSAEELRTYAQAEVPLGTTQAR